MNKLAFLTMIAASAVFFACGNEPSFYDQLTDEQKEMVSFEGYKVLECFDMPLEDLNQNDSLAVLIMELKTDLESLNAIFGALEVKENGINASIDAIKTAERPFPAATYIEPIDDKATLCYYYSGPDKEGYAFQIKDYEESKEIIMPLAIENQILTLESQDWRALTTPEEQLVTVMTALMSMPETSMFKFTTITIDGKPHRVCAMLEHQ